MAPPPCRAALAARVGACFVCFAEDADALAAGAEPAWAAAATFEGGRRVAAHVVAGTTAANYAPGLLALRAGPLLERAVAGLPVRPDVLLVDATGRDHPRRAGLALHLGAVLDLATVGVTDRPLAAVASAPGGSAEPQPLTLDGQLVAYRVWTRLGARPVIVHAAWRTDPATALAVVRGVAGATRTPTPLREARRLARTARAVAAGWAPRPPGDPAPS
ncbi:MAG: endonuclease V [Trueperaceae bacterium]